MNADSAASVASGNKMEPQLVRGEVSVRIARGAGMGQRRELKTKFI